MYLFRLLIPLAEQVEHGDRNAAGICGTQTEGSIDIRDPEAVHILQREKRVHQAEFRVDIRYLDGPRRYAIHFGKLPDQRLLGGAGFCFVLCHADFGRVSFKAGSFADLLLGKPLADPEKPESFAKCHDKTSRLK